MVVAEDLEAYDALAAAFAETGDFANAVDIARLVVETTIGDRESAAHAKHERLAATVACKAAVKAGDELSLGEMRALFIALGDTKLPAHDVHGRSTIVQLSWPELERRFGRQ